MKIFPIALFSDSTGETAEALLKAALAQFPNLKAKIYRFRSIRDSVALEKAVQSAIKQNVKFIATTFVQPQVYEDMVKLSQQYAIPFVPLMKELVETIGSVSDEAPELCPGLLRRMDKAYNDRVKAMEYTIACDDGRSPQLMNQADIVLFGVSRAGKTPLSLFLANKGYAVANVPLLPGVELDERVWKIDPAKRVGLLISAERLKLIREERLVLMGLDPEKAAYTSLERIEEELKSARKVMEQLECRVYDSTDRPIEELAQSIIDELPTEE